MFLTFMPRRWQGLFGSPRSGTRRIIAFERGNTLGAVRRNLTWVAQPAGVYSEHDRELRRAAGRAVQGVLEPVLAQYLLHHRQADALAVLLRTEERREEVVAGFS